LAKPVVPQPGDLDAELEQFAVDPLTRRTRLRMSADRARRPARRRSARAGESRYSGLFMFVADRPKDLSAGTLYVARLGEGFSIDPAAPRRPSNRSRKRHSP
jgi:hypothetical protein